MPTQHARAPPADAFPLPADTARCYGDDSSQVGMEMSLVKWWVEKTMLLVVEVESSREKGIGTRVGGRHWCVGGSLSWDV